MRYFDLLKAFGYIEKVSSNPIYLVGKDFLTSYVRNMSWATILYKYHGKEREREFFYITCDNNSLRN